LSFVHEIARQRQIAQKCAADAANARAEQGLAGCVAYFKPKDEK
jgi:hypothetical protein